MPGTYKEYDTLPAFERIVSDARGLPAPASSPDVLRWGGPHDVPKIDQSIQVTMNGLGPATVVRYFSEEGFLGLLVRFHNPPAWYVKQNGSAEKLGHIFGIEFRPVT